MKKRVLAALLALVMLFGALPMSVFAEDLETVEGPSGTFEPDEPEKYTYHLFHDFNYEGGSTWDIQATTATTPYKLDVNTGTPERKGYNFLGWADKSNATTAQYYGGELIELDKDNLTSGLGGAASARYHRPEGFCKDTVCFCAVQRQQIPLRD